MFCIFKYREGIDTKLHLDYKASINFKLIIFYHVYIYRVSVCFVFPCTVKVSIRNYACTTRPSVHLEIDHFLSWLCIQDFCMFCISKYR